MRPRLSSVSMLRIVCGLLFALCCTSSAYAQEAVSPPEAAKKPEPATAIEKFMARRGVLIVKDFYNVGMVSGQLGTSLEIKMLILSSAGGPSAAQKIFGVRFSRPAAGRYESEEVSFLDFDECVALLDALGFMQNLAIKMAQEQHEYTEVIFVTRGGMRIGFYQEGREQSAFAKVGGPIGGKRCWLTMDGLAEVKDLVQQAVTRLREMGAK